jgi:hypothetical protein
VQYGSQYSTIERYKVKLRKTKPYYLTVTDQRVEYFLLVARILHYLGSGLADNRCLRPDTFNALFPLVSSPVLLAYFEGQMDAARSPSPPPEEPMILDSIAVQPLPSSGPWECGPEDQLYPGDLDKS